MRSESTGEWRIAPYKSNHKAGHKYAIHKSKQFSQQQKSQAHYFLMASSNPSMTPGIFSPMYCCCSVTSNICSRSSWMPWATHNSHSGPHAVQCNSHVQPQVAPRKWKGKNTLLWIQKKERNQAASLYKFLYLWYRQINLLYLIKPTEYF